MANLDQNVFPYYDDFDNTKNFKRVLFRPSFAVQARELTQLQTNLSDQIKSITSPIIDNGESLVPGELRWSRSVPQLSLSSSASIYLLNDYTISDTTSNKYLIGKYIIGIASNAIAKIIAATPASVGNDLKLHLSVLTGSFTASEGIHIYNQTESGEGESGDQIGTSSTYTVDPTDQAVIHVKEGFFNINGYSIYTPSQILVTTDKNTRIGFNIVESFSTEADDTSLLDNSSGSTNYQAPGADRYTISLTLASKVTTISGSSTLTSADENFIEIARFDNFSKFVDLTSNYGDNVVQQQDLKDLTHQNNGDYIEQTPFITLKDEDHSKTSLNIGSGKAIINGNEVLFPSTNIELDKPSVSKTVDVATNSWPEVSVPFSQGNYITTQGGILWSLDPTADTSDWLKFDDDGIDEEVRLYREYHQMSDKELVATARIKNIETSPGITILQMEEEATGGVTSVAWIPGEIVYGSGSNAMARLIKVEKKVVAVNDESGGVEAVLLHVELLSGYFLDTDNATGATSGALLNISQVDDDDGLHYGQFEARDEYKFYLYDLKFEIDATTKEKYKLSDATLICNKLQTTIAYLNTNLSYAYSMPNISDPDGSSPLVSMGWPTQLRETTDFHGKDDTVTTHGDVGSSLL